jgi:hypothetical protein
MATLALLSGSKSPDGMIFGGHLFKSEIGGAPKAEVVPVRISESVIHLWTKTMAWGIDYALAPADIANNRCDVITISHGGLPCRSWAIAVNKVYEAGVVLAAVDMNGGGTSAATPQVAAACALWIEKNGAAFPKDWTRVQAVSLRALSRCGQNPQYFSNCD